MVDSGRMGAAILETNDAEHLILAMDAFRREHRRFQGVHLVLYGGGSQIVGETTRSFAECGGSWRPRLRPAHASGPNQEEILNHAFGLRSLRRGLWTGRAEYVAHVIASLPEYNRLNVHPFEWTWTNRKIRRWFAEYAP
jgi:hypothetical protein